MTNHMLTKEIVIEKLAQLEQEIDDLKKAVETLPTLSDQESTQSFLQKCTGWQDDRSVEDTIREIYQARTTSTRGAEAFWSNSE